LRSERFVRSIDEHPGRLLVGSADVVDPDIDASELGHRPFGNLFGEVPDIALRNQTPTAMGLDRRPGLLKITEAAGVDDDVAAELRQPESDRPTNALARAGHDGNVAVHPESLGQRHQAVKKSARGVRVSS